jgi:hypothetical protein
MTDEEWAEADYWDELWLQWQATLPTKMDFLLAFPQLLKEERTDLKNRLTEIQAEVRELKNKSVADYKNSAWYKHLITCRHYDSDQIKKELARLDWIDKPKSKEDVYDIQKAKAFPITNIIEIKRKVGKCPWHDDKHPSLHYYEQTNTVFCFPCDKSGDSIDVAMATWDLDWKEAVTRLTN